MTTRIPTWPAAVYYEAAWNVGPLQSTPPPWWTDITARALGAWSTTHGRQFEMDRNEAGEWRPALDNRDGALDPSNTAGLYYPNVAPYKGVRVRMPFGVNTLTRDQATAGEQSGYLGSIPAAMNIVNDFGYPISIVASGTAYQGTQVYQATAPIGATQFGTVLLVEAVPVVPNSACTFSAQVRIPSGNSVSTQAVILWFDANGNSLSSSTATGTAQTPTSGSSTWVQLSASTAAAPVGAYSAQLKLQIATGTLTGATTWQIDGLQWENSATPTPFQVPQSLGANLLPRAIATGSASISPVNDTVGNYWYATGSGTLAQATNLTAAPSGQSTALAWTTPSGTTSSNALLYAGVAPSAAPTGPAADCVQVTATQQYSASAYLSRASSADATVQVTLTINWFNSAGAALTATVGSAVTVPVAPSWVRATVTGSAPSGAMWGRVSAAITSPASTTATNVIYAAGWQFEQAAAASTWVDPGLTCYAFWGSFEQFPQVWRLSGTWSEVDAIGVDGLAGLAQYTVQQPFVEEVSALAPTFFYQLADPAGSSSCVDTTGNRIPAPVEVSPFGAGSLVFGSQVTSTNTGSAFIGTSGPVATFNNNPANTPQLAQTFISLHKTTVTPGPPTSGAWSRMIAFRCPSIPASGTFPTLWNANTPSYGSNQSLFQIYIDPTTGNLVVQLSGPAGTGPVVTSAANVCDGNWHLAMLAYTPGSYVDVFLDGTRIYHDNHSGAGWPAPTGIITDVIGCSITPGASNYSLGFVGDAAHATQFGFALTQAQATNLYNSWRTASSGESTGARMQRLLTWAGYIGPTLIDSGSTQSMGPATDLVGQSALNAAFAIATTENGNVFVTSAGVLRFESRAALYNATPAYIFGEKSQNGEWPYEDVKLPTDPIHTWNIIPVQQWSTGQIATAQSTSSQQQYYQRTLPQRTVNTSSFTEAQSAAQYLLGQYDVPRMRCSSLLLHPSAEPGLFRVCAQLEIGTRIRVMRRPASRSTPIQFDGFVQRAEWSMTPTGEAWLRVEASPADLASYWVLAALHTTLSAQANSGQAQATINALPDAYVNTLSQSLPQGYQLTFEPGTPRAETMTLSPTGIPFTGVGYQTATLTFTTNFAFTHPANSVVCEPLPTGYTDPTTWDTASVLGAASCTVISGGGSGTNTITVGPLGDSAVNAAGSDWATGDLLWISPNNPATFEGYNRLHPNVATAGEGALPLATGTFGYTVGLFTAYASNALQVTASGSAFQGSQVWQVTVPGASATGQDLVSALKLQCTPNLPFTGSCYVRSATSSQNPQVRPYIQWYDAYYNPVGSTTTGSTVTLTGSPTAAWTRVTATATAPAGAVFARIGVTLTSAPASSWAFQTDGLQFEQAAAASVFCVTPQVLSVAFGVPGYSSVTITLNTNLINSHSAGDTVCDPLPPGTTSPSAVASTARLAY